MHRLTATFDCEEEAQAEAFATAVKQRAETLGLSQVTVKQRKNLEELLGLDVKPESEDLRLNFDRVMDAELDEYGHYPD